jgi:hypothetical protein
MCFSLKLLRKEFLMIRKITVLAALLALVSAAAFADFTVNGTVEYDLNATTTLQEGKDTDTNAESDILDNSNVVVGLSRDALSAIVIIRTAGIKTGGLSGLFDFNAAWQINDLLALRVAYSWLPGAFFSALGIDGDANALLGASAVGRHAQVRLNIDGAYVGFWANGVHHPGFFAGYDFRGNGFSAGVNGIGAYNSDSEIFTLIGSLHGAVTFSPCTVRANVALYKDGNAISGALTSFGAGGELTDKPYLEGLVEFNYALDGATITATLGYGHNLDSGANTLRAGLAVPVTVVAGLRVIPGLIFSNTLSNGTTSDNAVTTLKYGVSLAYSF